MLPDVPGAKGEDYAEMFDALIIPGGPDADPSFFGEEPWMHIGMTNYKRDVFEAEIFKAFYKAGKPIFGICRGCQFINIMMGGSVYPPFSGCKRLLSYPPRNGGRRQLPV